MELVYLDGKKEPYTLSSIIADCANISHHAVQEHIRKQQKRLERFGKVSFQMRPLPSGQQAKDYILNEQQATLLITFLKNTEQVATFKENLVKAFFEMRDEVAEFRFQRALEKPRRKTLTEAIKCWENAPKSDHKKNKLDYDTLVVQKKIKEDLLKSTLNKLPMDKMSRVTDKSIK